MTTRAPLARMVEFELAFARRQAGHVQAIPGGFAVRHYDFPASQNNNRVLVTDFADSRDVLDSADSVLSDAQHRLITVYEDALGATFAKTAVAAGYQHVPLVAMSYNGGEPPPSAVLVEAVDVATLIASLRWEWRQLLPKASDDRIEQLAGRVAVRRRGADRVEFLGVVVDNRVAARVDLYIHDDVAQLEYVATAPEYRGHGYARAVVLEAVRRARAAGCGLIFLFAEELDWPSRWYGRLGFSRVGRIHEFSREDG